MNPHDYRWDKAAKSGSSFYQLHVPAPRAPPGDHRAVCLLPRVDDVVDECRDLARWTKLEWWRQEVGRSTAHAHPSGRTCAEGRHQGLPPARRTVAPRSSTAWRWTCRRRYLDFRPAALLLSRRQRRRLLASGIFGYQDRQTPKRTHDLRLASSSPTSSATSARTRAAAIYLPIEDLQRFDVPAKGPPRARFSDAPSANGWPSGGAAEKFYDRAFAQLPRSTARRSGGLVMAAIHRTLLREIARDGFLVLDRRTSLTPLRRCGSRAPPGSAHERAGRRHHRCRLRRARLTQSSSRAPAGACHRVRTLAHHGRPSPRGA